MHPPPGSWHITKACLQNLWKVGAPLAAERAALSSAQVLLVRIVSGLGTTAIAANSLGVSAESLCYMAGYGVQDASLAMVGQAVGAHRRDMAKSIAWLCTGMGMAIMALTGVGLYVFAPALMGIFTADAAVIALGAQVLRIEAFAEPMFGASIVASGAMQGAGDSTGCFVLNLVSMWGIRLTLAVLLAPRFGLVGVWFAMCASCAPAVPCSCSGWPAANGWTRARWPDRFFSIIKQLPGRDRCNWAAPAGELLFD